MNRIRANVVPTTEDVDGESKNQQVVKTPDERKGLPGRSRESRGPGRWRFQKMAHIQDGETDARSDFVDFYTF